ncbi:hypothetical protein EV360DRAFT_84909 [Lentinula raphanica]|nr:hypothetical protein EV360DRAFT_84909 [Lentinula raphanica]
MGSTALRHPDKVFDAAPPPPLHWPAAPSILSPMNTIPRTLPSVQWKKSSKTFTGALSSLQDSLRHLHKRKIHWPIEDVDSSSNLTPTDYLMMLLRPVPTIFNLLNTSDRFKTPMECLLVDLAIRGVTFALEELKLKNLAAPIVVPLLGDLFDSLGQIHAYVEFAVSIALDHSPKATIIISNFTDIVIFLPATWVQPEPIFERVSTTQPSLALRVLATAYLLNIEIEPRLLITPPPPDFDFGQDFSNLQGPPQDPGQLLPDEDLFASHYRHSDFDIVTLVRDPARALQFFRWHKHISETVSKVVAHPHDTLTAKANEAGLYSSGIRPLYPFDTSEIPPDTAEHLQAIQRESSLAAAGIDSLLKNSKFFTIDIEDVIDEGSERGICTVYRCRITTIDDVPVSSPSLCLKLFDDRFQQLQSPDDEEPDDDEPDDDELTGDELTDDGLAGIPLHVVPLNSAQLDAKNFENNLRAWLAPMIYAETYAITEVLAYDKLLPVQGSVVPWFYGFHQFKLADGVILYGLLMEFIEGWKYETSTTRELSPERQIKMIQSCRHAVRVLDIADVSQFDWHTEQFLLCTNPVTKVDHVVLLDFASTMQTWDPDDPIHLLNYFSMFRVLARPKSDQRPVGFCRELVLDHYGEPDDWNPLLAWLDDRKVQARNMFDYITPAWP